MTQKLDFVRLEHTDGHNKFYEIWIEANPSNFSVHFKYGAIGSSGVGGIKYTSGSTIECKKMLNDLKNEKISKGYHAAAQVDLVVLQKGNPMLIVKSGTLTAGKTHPIETTPALMLLTAGKESDLEKFINDDDWAAQPKVNAKRALIHVEYDVVKGTSRTGKEMDVHPAIMGRFRKFCHGKGRFVFDGELHADEYDPFDLLVCANTDIRNRPLHERYEFLEDMRGPLQSGVGCIDILELSCGKTEKQALVDKLRKANREGVVFKKLNAKYLSGKADKLEKAIAVKIKFWESNEFVVIKWN